MGDLTMQIGINTFKLQKPFILNDVKSKCANINFDSSDVECTFPCKMTLFVNVYHFVL